MTAVAQRPLRVAAVAAAPVFYQVPLYRTLAADPRVDLTVLFASDAGVRPYDAAFGRSVQWDTDLVSGYRSEFLHGAESAQVLGGFFALRGRDVFRRILGGGYDVLWLHGFSYVTCWLALAAARLRGVPVLMREEQTLLRRRRGPKSWVRALVLRLLFSQVYALSIGTNNRAYFRRYGVPEERIFFAPYAVENAALRQAGATLAGRRREIRAELGVPDGQPLVLFVGKLNTVKQPLLLLEAFRMLRADHACSLLLVGDGPLRDEVASAAASIPDVSLVGFLNRSEIGKAYAAADVFVLPSRSETWGLVLNEAMNFSLPIVTTEAVGSAADLVRSGENGYVVPSDDAGALADALAKLVEDPQRRAALGQRSREIVAGWSYETAASGIVAACESARRRA